ncbi:MAG: energy-coupling factor transporter transmembrane protein EcfT [Firmicutes bacterium]|nr:energy-coupling factor transporter transmembrane protein EcfT [Bacillota bacterium]
MLNNFVLGRYYKQKSKIHLMHPLSKIICTLSFIIMIFICNDIKLMILLGLIAILMAEMSKVPRRIYFKSIFSLKYILLFILIINLIFQIDKITTIMTMLRLILIVIYTTLLTLTTPPTEITYGLELLLAPLKIIRIPVNKMALSISLALRFIPTIIDQGNKILKSQASRGIDYYNSNLKGKFIAIKAMIIPMFIITLKKADNLADAMTVRLYSVNAKRTNFRINKWHFFDSYMVLIHLTILVLVIYRYL